jgi:hypothetical protein
MAIENGRTKKNFPPHLSFGVFVGSEMGKNQDPDPGSATLAVPTVAI